MKSIFLVTTSIVGFIGLQNVAEAASFTPLQMSNNWTRTSDPVRGEREGKWGVDTDGSLTNDLGHPTNQFRESWAAGALISDFTSSSSNFSFSGWMRPYNDDDAFSAIFGYQNSDNMYRLSWTGHYFMGYSGDYARYDGGGLSLVKEVGGVTQSLWNNNKLTWLPNLGQLPRTHDYKTRFFFNISRKGQELSVLMRKEDPNTLVLSQVASFSVFDSTFLTGKIGLNAINQGVNFGNIKFQSTPEPLTILGAGLAVGFGTFFKREYSKSKLFKPKK